MNNNNSPHIRMQIKMCLTRKLPFIIQKISYKFIFSYTFFIRAGNADNTPSCLTRCRGKGDGKYQQAPTVDDANGANGETSVVV